MKQNKKKSAMITFAFGIIPIGYLGLLLANAFENDCNLLTAVSWITENPFEIGFCDSTIKTLLIVFLIYGFCIIYYINSIKNYRNGEEYGSAKWGDPARINKELINKHDKSQNKILTQNVSIGLDGFEHQRNLNTIGLGGSGAGKTKFLIQPNILQCSSSYGILDPKGENLRDNGNLLKLKGYEIVVLNLKDPQKSWGFNPFAFIQNDDDIQKIATIYMRATTPKKSKSNDPYWEQQAEVLLKAFMFYLYYEAPPEEQNFGFLLDMLREAVVIEGKEEEKSIIDELFEELEAENPDHIAVKFYKDVRNIPGRTFNTIMSTLKGRLEKFNLESIRNITSHNDIDFLSLATRKTALFLVVPDNDKSYNFLISILYMQMFQHLANYADSLPGGRLPIHVQFLMDEFTHVTLPDDFEDTISLSRSRGFSFTIIIQNISQLKAQFDKLWDSIIGNCDTFVYLGGNEQSSHEYVSKSLGKETLDIKNYGKTSGKNGSNSTNYQRIGRELMLPEEVRGLKNDTALLFVRGCDPVIDKKYNVWKHPNAKYTTLGAKNKRLKNFAKKHPNIKFLSKWRGGEPYDDEGLALKQQLTSFTINEIKDSDNFNGTVIDLDELMDDIEKEVKKIKENNYL